MAAENKANNPQNDPRKRKRCYLPHNRPVRKKGGSPLRPGVVGFFITCDGGREHQAAQEAINVIDFFFEELISGKESSSMVAATAKKPLNKKITFTYSDSEEDEDDGNDDEQEDNKSASPPKDGGNNGSNVEEISDHADKGDQVDDTRSKKTVVDNKEAEQSEGKGEEDDNGQAEGNSKENDKEQAEGKSEENDKEQAEGKSEENDKGQAEEKIEENDKEQDEENEEPPEKKQCSDAKKSESGNEELATAELSVDKLIEAELKEIKDKNKRRFSKLDTGCNGVVFIHMRRRDGDPSPTEIVQHMMESAASTKKHMSRFLLRVLPVELSCYASEEEISRAIKPLVEKQFPVDAETPAKFAVQYDARANSGVERMKIIDAIAKSIPAPHKVDLKNPEKTIVAQVVKTVCMIGVVVKYKELAKYNLRQLTS